MKDTQGPNPEITPPTHPARRRRPLELMTSVDHHTPAGEEPSACDVYVEQAELDKDVCTVRFVCTAAFEFAVTFLNARALDTLSNFFARAAQKLRYCTK